MKRIPPGLSLLLNLKNLDLDGNALEFREEQALVVQYHLEVTAANVAAYLEQKFGAPRSLLLLCSALRMLAVSGIPLLAWCFPVCSLFSVTSAMCTDREG